MICYRINVLCITLHGPTMISDIISIYSNIILINKMKKGETNYKVWGGKNMLRCDDCSCGNWKCEDGAYFCSRCGVWRIVLALALFMVMFKVGYIVGYSMSEGDAADSQQMGLWSRVHKSDRAVTNNMLDSKGCDVNNAMTWSKVSAKCVKLYEDAHVLYDVMAGPKISYVLAKDKDSNLELFYNGSQDGVVMVKKGAVWISDDAKYRVEKTEDGKMLLVVLGRVSQVER